VSGAQAGPPGPAAEVALLEDAIAAEFETGRREPTRAAALASVAARLARMGAGSALLALGAVMLVLPGPGLVVVAAGLAILARDVAWAARLADRVRTRIDAIPTRARRPALVVGVVAAGTASLVAVGLAG
jgi:hypothetical protein